MYININNINNNITKIATYRDAIAAKNLTQNNRKLWMNLLLNDCWILKKLLLEVSYVLCFMFYAMLCYMALIV